MHTAAGRAPAAAPQLPAASASSSLGGSSGPSAARAGGSAAGRPAQKFPAARLRPRAILKLGRVVGPRRAAERVDADARIGRGPPWLPGGGGSGRVRVLRAAIDPGPGARACTQTGPPGVPMPGPLERGVDVDHVGAGAAELRPPGFQVRQFEEQLLPERVA